MTQTVQRFDLTGKLDKFERTGAGAVRIPARIARTGLQQYRDESGKLITEYRPADEVFKEDSLKTLAAIPVTIGHPTEDVTTETWASTSVGHVTELPSGRTEVEGESWIETAAFVAAGPAVAQVAANELTEVSMGYTVEIDETPGVLPDGRRYDCIQRNIRFNHLALLPAGQARAGRNARLRTDGHQIAPVNKEKPHMADENVVVKVRLDGKEYVEGSADHLSALTAISVALQSKIDAADAAQAKADAAVEKLEADLVAAKTDAEDASRIDAAIAFRDDARKLLGADYAFGKKTELEVKRDALAKVSPKLDLEGKSDSYVDARYDIALEAYVAPTADGATETKTEECSMYLPYHRNDSAEADYQARLNAGNPANRKDS